MKQVKSSGNGKFKEMRPNEMRNQQSDLIADIVCSDCEMLFSKSDEFGAYFFKEQKYLMRIAPSIGLDFSDQLQIHSGEVTEKIDLFVASILIRLDLYAQKMKIRRLLEPYFNELGRHFLNGYIDSKKFGCFIMHQPNLDTTISPPMRNIIEERNCIISYFLGYKLVFFLTNRGLPESVFHCRQRKSFLVPVLNHKDPEFRSIAKELFLPNMIQKKTIEH